mgnify:CR=1 FL=1
MKRLDEIMSALKRHKKELKEKFGVKEIGVFGSYVKGKETKSSDIDIYVEFDLKELTFDKYLGLLEYLENLLGGKIDLITKDGVETIRIPYIKEEIKRSLIYA